MKKITYQIASLIMTLVMILGNTIHTKAAGNDYYVSPMGSDTNPGTSAAPFRTFAKANSVLTAGSTLHIYTGVYTEQLKITQSGTSSAVITVQPYGGQVIIDQQSAPFAGVDIRASYVTVSGLEIRNSGDVCVNLLGSDITVNGLNVHECYSHGIQVNNSSNVKILNSQVYRAVLSNAARILTGGWGSAIKVRVSDNVLIQGNLIYNNFGEGMGTRGTNITIRGNTVHDNYSVNIYTNSENVVIERNFVYCTPNSGYERSGQPAAGISMGEEYFDGWGARLNNARVLNNIVTFCKHGIRYNGAEGGVTGGGLRNAIIAYNTLYGSTSSALSIVYESAQFGSLIANNIIWQAQNNLATIDSPAGLTFQNNLWKVAPPIWMESLGDRVGEPQFITTPGYMQESYIPAVSSLAAGAAANIGVMSDYYGKQRDRRFDIGAIQFSSSSTKDPAAAVWSIFTRGNFYYGVRGDIPVPADYDGDGRHDIAVFRPSNSTWYIAGIGDFAFGREGDIPVVGNYNGDRKSDIAVFRPSNSTWYVSGVGEFLYGTRGDIPVVADYNGDRKDDIAVFRPSNSTWYIHGMGEVVYGAAGDIPVVADYNGDRKDDIAVFRPSNSTWYIHGMGEVVYGAAGDIPVVADYNRDGKDDVAVFRPSNGTWYVAGRGSVVVGEAGDIPLPGDYNGDGRDDIAIFQP